MGDQTVDKKTDLRLIKDLITCQRLGGEERRLKHLVPAPAVRLMKSRVLSRPGVNSLVHKESYSGS